MLTRTVIAEHRWKMAATYGLTAVEILFDLLYPFAIGLAVNGLLVGNAWSLLPLAVVWLSHTSTGYLRQRYDTRLFTRIYTAIASRMTVEQRAAGESTSEIAARTDMAEDLVEFLEFEIPMTMMALAGLVGGAIMLCTYDLLAGSIMAAVLLPAAWLYWRYGRTALDIERRYNDRAEREVAHIHSSSAASVRRHFRHLSRWRVRLSDAEARTWSVLELISMGIFLAVLVRLTQVPGLQAGDIFAALAYALAILDALDMLPERIGALSRTLDTVRRMR